MNSRCNLISSRNDCNNNPHCRYDYDRCNSLLNEDSTPTGNYKNYTFYQTNCAVDNNCDSKYMCHEVQNSWSGSNYDPMSSLSSGLMPRIEYFEHETNDTCFNRFFCDSYETDANRCEDSNIAPINIDESLKNNNIVKTPCLLKNVRSYDSYKQICVNNDSICSQNPQDDCTGKCEWIEDTKICRRNLAHSEYCNSQTGSGNSQSSEINTTLTESVTQEQQQDAAVVPPQQQQAAAAEPAPAAETDATKSRCEEIQNKRNEDKTELGITFELEKLLNTEWIRLGCDDYCRNGEINCVN